MSISKIYRDSDYEDRVPRRQRYARYDDEREDSEPDYEETRAHRPARSAPRSREAMDYTSYPQAVLQ